MKLPNGYGSVYKLSGKRRNPYVAKKTRGWEYDPDRQKCKQLYTVVGYYPTRKAALEALAAYNTSPYDVQASKLTFNNVYERWSKEHFPKISDSGVKGYSAAWKLCSGIQDMKFVDVKLDHLQEVVNASGKNYPTLKKLKSMWALMYKYAVIHEIITKDRDMVEFVDIKQSGNPNGFDRKPFSSDQVSRIWKVHDTNTYYSVILILIYTGCRISELLDLKKSEVNLSEKYFKILEAKTDAGVRTVPIADKLLPFFNYWMDRDCEYLICTPEGRHFEYRNYYDSYWKPLMQAVDMEHRPHDTRHTCISMLAAAKVDDKIIKKIVGHKGQGVTETIYTHFELSQLLDAINKI